MTLNIEHKPQIFDKHAFESLFKGLFPALCAFAQKYISDLDTSKEIVHDSFINLWNKRDEIDPNRSVKSYLYTSVQNKCLNHIRDNKKFHTNLEVESLDFKFHNESDKLVEQELEKKINDTIKMLPDKCQEVFLLNRFEELKYSEIADKLEISIKTVEAQMSKALKFLRENLVEYLTVLILFILLKK